ncbi:MAG TPA: DUF481 domain-containing protein [Acidobacteriaceae bacterium]|jgi:hypothetical protein
MSLLPRFRRFVFIMPFLLILMPLDRCMAQDKKADAAPDTLVLSNGDTIHGRFVGEIGGAVTFHSDPLGDLTVKWSDIKELHAGGSFAVLNSDMKHHGKKAMANLPQGSIDATGDTVTVQPASQAAAAPVATKSAEVIVTSAELDKQLHHEPSFFAGWNGAATAGATLVTATQDSYAVSGSVGLIRTVPTAAWLDPRNRTSFDFAGSFGKITQPSFTSGGVFTPSTSTKSSILHFDAERDEYVSPRIFALGQAAFDHNYSQDLNLQQIYGGGLGWTALKTPKQEADLKATVQYEKQSFITGTPSSQNLIGSTFSANYLLKLKLVTYTQEVGFIPAYNNERAYSAAETNTFAFPAYKNFGFSVGTLDSYLNDPPATEPATKRNSFQFTMGLTYAFKSKY